MKPAKRPSPGQPTRRGAPGSPSIRLSSSPRGPASTASCATGAVASLPRIKSRDPEAFSPFHASPGRCPGNPEAGLPRRPFPKPPRLLLGGCRCRHGMKRPRVCLPEVRAAAQAGRRGGLKASHQTQQRGHETDILLGRLNSWAQPGPPSGRPEAPETTAIASAPPDCQGQRGPRASSSEGDPGRV